MRGICTGFWQAGAITLTMRRGNPSKRYKPLGRMMMIEFASLHPRDVYSGRCWPGAGCYAGIQSSRLYMSGPVRLCRHTSAKTREKQMNSEFRRLKHKGKIILEVAAPRNGLHWSTVGQSVVAAGRGRWSWDVPMGCRPQPGKLTWRRNAPEWRHNLGQRALRGQRFCDLRML